MDFFTTWKNPWLKVFKQNGFKVTDQEREYQIIRMNGKNIALIMGSPHCEDLRIRSALIADHADTYDKQWKCPVRIVLPDVPNDEFVTQMWQDLYFLRDNVDLANVTFGNEDGSPFRYDTYDGWGLT